MLTRAISSMFMYLPRNLAPSAPLVVLLHGCTQSAASYDKGTGWSTLADRYGFAVLLPQQKWKNNPLRCFNWFRPQHIAREQGEALSIKQMIERMLASHDIDRRRIYVTGLSSGGAMTAVMLATYPEVFAGGAILAGVPYRAATDVQNAFETIFQGAVRSPGEWGDLVRSASAHEGPWPRVSVWHGDADKSVKPTNAEEIVKQWTNLHGLAPSHTIETRVDGHRRRVWQDAEGEDLVESYTIAGMTHGAAISPGEAEHQCGTVAPFFEDAGISSTYRIASFWGLVGARRDIEVATSAAAQETRPPEYASAPRYARTEHDAHAEERSERGTADAGEGRTQPNDGAGHRGVDVEGIIAKSLEMAGLLKGGRSGTSDAGPGRAGPLGINVHGIIATSLEAAGLLKVGSAQGKASRAQGTMPLGIDVPGIIATALEAAGVLNASREASTVAGGGDGRSGLAGSGWDGEGWEFVLNDPQAFRGGPMLFGQATSGDAGGVGRKVRSVSRRMSFGPRPELSYVRRIALSAAANPYTSATFRVLVDGVPVDEVSAIGMDYAETEWTRRAGIDLGQFADRTVTLTLEVAATSNVHSEVLAKVWVDEVTVGTAKEVEQV